MDKQRVPPGPKAKTKRAIPPPGDFIALGSKSQASKPLGQQARSYHGNNPQQTRNKSAAPSTHTTTSGIQRDKRKELSPVNLGSAAGGGPVGKQARIGLGAVTSPSTPTNRNALMKDFSKALDSKDQQQKNVNMIEAPAHEVEQLVLSAYAQGDQEQVEGLVCGALKTLRMNKMKPEPILYLSLTSLVKQHPEMFTNDVIVEHMLHFLRSREPGTGAAIGVAAGMKTKPNILLCIMACNILYHAFQNEHVWPQSFIKVCMYLFILSSLIYQSIFMKMLVQILFT